MTSSADDPFGHGERAVAWLRRLRHPKSRAPGKAWQLDPWMEDIVRRTYGPAYPDGRRITRSLVIVLPRGNRKTTFGAALALLHTIGPERVNGGQIVAAAADQKQARIAFDEAAAICRDDPRIGPKLRFADYKNRLENPKSGAFLEAISCDAGTQHGRTPSFVLADELHAWKKRDLWDVLRTGLVKTPGSLLVVITTAGRGRENIAFEIVDYARRVARGDVDDPATLPILYEAPGDADWRDEDLWHAVNPGLACDPPYPDIEGLRQLAREAAVRPADQAAFKQLHLCMWLDGSADPWLDMALWDAGAGEIDLDAREGEPAWIGVDLGSTGDLTAVVLALRDDDGGYTVAPFVFAPEDTLSKRRGDAPFAAWAETGHLLTTPGNVTDYAVVTDLIRDLCRRFRVEEIALDPWGARPLINQFLEEGLPAVEHRQGYVSMSGPMNEVERAVLSGRLRHDGNPVLRWCVDNVAVDRDPAGNVKPNKDKSRRGTANLKIDAAVAMIMAVGRAAAGGTSASIYESADRPDGLLVF